MLLSDAFRDEESEARAFRLILHRIFGAVKFVENEILVLLGDADAVVRDDKRDGIPLRYERDAYVPTGLRIFYSDVNEILDHEIEYAPLETITRG